MVKDRIEVLVSIWNRINADQMGMVEHIPESTDSAIVHEQNHLPPELFELAESGEDVESFLSFE